MTGARPAVARAVELLRDRRRQAGRELEDVVDALDRYSSPALHSKRDRLAAIVDAIDATLSANESDNDLG